ncbi:MAG: SAF domain-containing protein [Acidimicrobiales bacterium]
MTTAPRSIHDPAPAFAQVTAGTRVAGSRRGLPNGRAVLGGLLVAVAVLGVFSAYRSATSRAAQRFVVAARDVAPGTRLTAADLILRTVDLPPELAQRAATDPADLVGDVAVAPLAAGDLIQASSVVAGNGPSRPELSFAVDADRAVNGDLAPGEVVDVLVTYGTGDTAWTEVVVRGAMVIAVDDGHGGALTIDGTTVLTLGLPGAADVLPAAHAVRAGDVTVVRTTTSDQGGDATTYRPDPPPFRANGDGG